jgi:PAS domain S-box-containing protein
MTTEDAPRGPSNPARVAPRRSDYGLSPNLKNVQLFVLSTFFIGSLILLSIAGITGSAPLLWDTIAVFAASAVSWVLCRNDYFDRALAFPLCVAAGCALRACYLFRGINDVGAMLIPVLILMTGLLLSRRFVFVYTTVVMLGAAGVMAARWVTRVDVFGLSPAMDLVLFILTCGMAAIITAQLGEHIGQTYRAIRQREERLEQLAEQSRTTAWEVDSQGLFTFVSRASEASWGYLPGELEGRKYFYDLHPAEGREEYKALIFGIVARKQSFRDIVHPMEAKDGRLVWASAVGIPLLNDDGTLRGYRGSCIDITGHMRAEERIRESERRLDSIYNTLSDTVFQLAVEPGGRFRFVSVNAAFLRTTGLSIEAVIGKTVREVVPEPSLTTVLEKYRQAVEEKTIVHWEETSDYPTGRLTGEVSISPVFDDKGRCTHLVGSVHDITKRKRAEAETSRLQLQLAQAQKMESIGRLAGGIAHDFSNLMSVILLHADSALHELRSSDPLVESVTAIMEASRRAVAMTQRLMSFSRKQVLQVGVLDLDIVIADTGKLLRPLIGEDIRLVVNPCSGSCLVKADRGQIGQIIVNLAVNSRDAMPYGGTLTIATACVELDEGDAHLNHDAGPGSWVMVSVSDTGVGMDRDTQDRAFDPFFTTKEVGKGTGLGLSMVYGIVRQSGGFITVNSEQGRGAEFRIYLPRAVETPEQNLVNKIEPVQFGGETILVVEDEAALRGPVCRLLENAGYRVLTGNTVNEAIQVAMRHNGSLDLLLTDVVMPDMSGPQLANHLQPLHPQMKVLYMSGYPEPRQANSPPISDGDFIQKPFTTQKLLGRLREVLEGREVRR